MEQMKRFKKIWLPIIVSVISGILINWLTPLNIPGAIWKIITWFVGLFVIKATLPVWGIILLMLVIPLLIGIVIVFFLLRTNSTETYLTYTSDTFFGISWYWRYTGNKLYKEDIIPRCLSCKTLLQPSNVVVNEFTLICSHCGFQKEFEYSYDELLNRVKKEIDRKIITEEYKTVKQTD